MLGFLLGTENLHFGAAFRLLVLSFFAYFNPVVLEQDRTFGLSIVVVEHLETRKKSLKSLPLFCQRESTASASPHHSMIL